ncbi:hypothetical protein BLOT_004592 [Blomia tropicalis]|nr:hypothetical protein BLOT_004592 [Blomia tropicalis]
MVQFEKRINVNFFCRQLLLTGSSWLKISKLYYIRLDIMFNFKIFEMNVSIYILRYINAVMKHLQLYTLQADYK